MLRLRPYKNSDAESIAGWIGNEREFDQWSAGEWGEYPLDADKLRTFGSTLVDNDRLFQVTICEDKRVIGYLLMQYMDEERRMMRFSSFILDPKLRGNGVGREALKLALRLAFEFLDVSRIVACILEGDESSYACYKSAGFWDAPTDAFGYVNIRGRQVFCKLLETYPHSDHMYQKVSVGQEEAMLNEIIEKNSFLYAFQPIVEAKSGKIFGYEALMRAEYDGLISPSVILENAKKYQKLYEIEKASFFNTIGIAQSQQEAFGERKVFINSIPGYLLTEADYQELLDRYGTDWERFVVEITESAELPEEEWRILRKRSETQRFKLAIDDYGTGYANTTNLLKHMPNYVKIDRLLISDINEDDKKQHFVKSMIDFAHANGFMALAEGVETAAELKVVVQMGIDLLQGYYLGRPTFDILQEIDTDVRSELTNVGILGQAQSGRKIFKVDGVKELPLMRIALEQNTGILISQPEFTLIGNTNYTAVMSVKIMDGCDCRLTIRNVFLEGFRDLPCIEIGKNAHLTLVLEGENKFQKSGIFVPEGSSLTIEGSGNLQIRAQGIQSYGIGNRSDAAFGNIVLNGSGFVDILIEADEGVAIGGGFQQEGNGIRLASGMIRIEPASERAVGIGTFVKSVPINIDNTTLQLDLRVGIGVGIGCANDDVDVVCRNSKLTIMGSGGVLSGIGSNQSAGGSIRMEKSEVSLTLSGQTTNLIGSKAGDLKIQANHCHLQLRGEGAEVMGMGARDHHARIDVEESDCTVIIRSADHIALGAMDENVRFEGGTHTIEANA